MEKDVSASEAGRALVSHRRRLPGTCEVCGKPFVGYVNRRFCGQVCKHRALERRKAAARKAEAGSGE